VTENLPEHLSHLNLSQAEGIEGILTLLNLVKDPAILYNSTQDRIVAANNVLFLLSGLEEKDFIGKEIQSLLPNLTDANPITGHGQKTRLRHKKQPLILVTVRIFSLAKESDHIILLLQPEGLDSDLSTEPSDQTELLQKLHKLLLSRTNKDLKAALLQVLEVSKALLDVEVICLYKASGTIPQLHRYLSSDEVLAGELPEPLTSEDLSGNQKLALWTDSEPATNQLQKTAASANFTYLVSVPLGSAEAKFGLFVAGGKTRQTHPNLLPMAKLIAEYTTGLMEDQIALQNTRTLSNKIKQVVKIQNEIIANLEEGILILTPDLSVAEINQAAENMLGYANVEALRQPVDSILIGSESFGSAFSSAREGYPTIISGDLTLHHRDGKSFPAQLMTTPVMSDGKLIAIIVLIRDTSQAEENQAEKKQLEQRAILGEVTAIFAHEVRNPLNAITLALQVMEESLPAEDENMKWIRKIQDECNNLIQLMESVLSFAKPLEYKMSEVDLGQMIKQLLERWHPRFLRLGISSYFETEIDSPVVQGDIRALEQVFTNLISNAVKAMSDDGGYLGIKITKAELDEDEQFYQINITDSGPGIPADIKDQIFKPFVTGNKHGTGLGLAITQRIINAHKGKIEVDSFPGGTMFKVFLAKQKEYFSL